MLKMLKKIIKVSLIFFGLFLLSASSDIKADTFSYYSYTSGKTETYSGVSPKYVINGVSFDIGTHPAIINSSGVAMASATKLLGEGLGMSVSYNSSLNRLTIKYNNKTMVLYTDKDKAIFNGIEVTPGARPIRIKYENGDFTTLVPTRYILERFGIGYDWNSSTSTVTLKSPKKLRKDGEMFLYSKELCRVTYDGKTLDIGETPGYLIDNTSFIPAKNVLRHFSDISYNYTSSTGKITIQCKDIVIKMSIGSTYTEVNGVADQCPIAPCKIYDYDTKTTVVYIPAEYTFKTLGYNYSFGNNPYTCKVKTSGNEGQYKSGVTPFRIMESEGINTTGNYRQVLDLPIPTGCSVGDLKMTEYSQQNMMTVTIPGDHREFYKNVVIKNSGEAIIQIQFIYNDSSTIIKLFTRTDSQKTILTAKTEFEAGNLKLTLDKPKNLFDKVIVLDAGHGAHDPGTTNFGYKEKDINLQIVYTACRKYFEGSDIKVIYTRIDDTFVTLDDRAAFAKRCGADFFISIHQNNNSKDYCNGISIYESKTNKVSSGNGLTANAMSKLMMTNMLAGLKANNMGNQIADFDVLVYNSVPAILIECGFMSNPDEIKLLSDASYQDKIGKIVFETCEQYYSKYFS